MPYRLTWEGEGIALRFSGVLAAEDVAGSNAEIHADPRFAGLRFGLIDLSDVTAIQSPSQIVRDAARLDAEAARSLPGLRVALVASTPAVRGVANVYALTVGAREGWTTSVFDDEQEARAWLGVGVQGRATGAPSPG